METTEQNNDVQNARVLQQDKLSKKFIYQFAWFWSIISIAYIFGITFFTIPAANVRYADTCLGFILGSVIAVILGYFYGSSQGSKEKTEAMTEMVKESK